MEQTTRPLIKRRGPLGVALVSAVIGLPLVGAAWTQRDLSQFFRFPPPLQIQSDYRYFSWVAASGVLATVVIFGASWIFHTKPSPPPSHSTRPTTTTSAGRKSERGHFPAWGWASVAWTLGCWVLAWTRWPWFEPLQRFTFFPLWLGFIVTVNALTQRRAGTCLMRRAPRIWLALFGISALFWWIFEWLNRFVRNWHYVGAENFDAISYAVHASVCFSTVLPAVAAVAEWLGTYPAWRTRTANGPRWPWLASPRTAIVLPFAGAAALVLTGAYPAQFYAALWIAPLALLLSEPILTRRRSVTHEIAEADWSRAATWMIAALICGFFWELWNWKSFTKWIYTVPGVDRWHVFEMPLLGYAGYLPFGLECLLVIDRFIGIERTSA